MMNRGAARIAKSVRIHGTPAAIKRVRRFPQCLGIVGSQFDRIGLQMNTSAAVTDTHHKIMVAASTRIVIWKARVSKIRWKR